MIVLVSAPSWEHCKESQCFRSGSRSELDPGFNKAPWIRIQAGSLERKKIKKFHVWRALRKAAGYSWSLNVLRRGLIRHIWWVFISKDVPLVNLNKNFAKRNLGLDPDPAGPGSGSKFRKKPGFKPVLQIRIRSGFAIWIRIQEGNNCPEK